RAHRHLPSLVRVAADRARDRSFAPAHTPPDEGQVDLSDLAAAKLRREGKVRAVVLGDDEQARGPSVEPVHDAGALRTAEAGERTSAGQQSMDDRAALVAGPRMNDESGG